MLLVCSACSLGYLINTEMVSYQDSPHSFNQLLLYSKGKKKSTTLREDRGMQLLAETHCGRREI